MILFIDACKKESKTRRLAEALLKRLDGDVQRLWLYEEDLPTLDDNTLNERMRACAAHVYDGEIFRYAKQFAEADSVVIAAPYWDLSFPAILKKYIEAICVVGITFRYSERGIPIGLCRAKKLYYVTTAGGTIFRREYGYGYIQTLANGMFGIPECQYFSAENLDIVGNDPEAILQKSIDEIQKAVL